MQFLRRWIKSHKINRTTRFSRFIWQPWILEVEMVFIQRIDCYCFQWNSWIFSVELFTIFSRSTEHDCQDILNFRWGKAFMIVSPGKIFLFNSWGILSFKNKVIAFLIWAISTIMNMIMFFQLGDRSAFGSFIGLNIFSNWRRLRWRDCCYFVEGAG